MESAVYNSSRQKLSAGKIRSQYKKYLEAISKAFSGEHNTSEEAVHDLRVNLKRVDALIDLLKDIGTKVPRGKLKSFKTLFRVSGRLRAVQVEFDVIDKYFTNDSFNTNYLHQLHEVKAKRLHAYTRLLQSGVPRPLKEGMKLLKKKIAKLTKKDIDKYLNAERKKVARRLARSIFREQEIHFIRKDMKRYFLNLKAAEYESPRIERMLELLGEWHDHQVAYDNLVKNIYTGRMTRPESEPIKQIKFKLINDKEDLYEKIVAYYADELQPANTEKESRQST